MADKQTAEQTTQTGEQTNVNDSELMIVTLICFLLSDSETAEQNIAATDLKLTTHEKKFLFRFVVALLCLLFLIPLWYFAPFLFLIYFVVDLLSWTTRSFTQIADKPVVKTPVSSPVVA